jgi:hypothetical protein
MTVILNEKPTFDTKKGDGKKTEIGAPADHD